VIQPDITQAQQCYIDQFPHQLPHRDAATLRPCGHLACDPHTITYYGTGEAGSPTGGLGDAREGDYCMVCYERTFPGLCPDRVLRAAIQGMTEERGV
jgi:hypothetical protein